MQSDEWKAAASAPSDEKTWKLLEKAVLALELQFQGHH